MIGAGDLRDSAKFRRIRVARIIAHAGYFNQDGGIDADIALLKLWEAITDMEPLPLISDESLAAPGIMSRAIGWGLKSEGGEPFSPASGGGYPHRFFGNRAGNRILRDDTHGGHAAGGFCCWW
ncbi:MAG: hypothetical protein M2R45_02565 [Verrucomicrobia subdivision 3 bacterium]|nr:hypothetical protein [Limisphaerales bacterium]MCS1414228.1 hypothetical protein [Limisphaerales bacterium]